MFPPALTMGALLAGPLVMGLSLLGLVDRIPVLGTRMFAVGLVRFGGCMLHTMITWGGIPIELRILRDLALRPRLLVFPVGVPPIAE